MILDEVILHAEKITAEQEGRIKEFAKYGADTGSVYEQCKECAEEHRQLAEWLNELKRARVLLKATHELLMKQEDSGYVLNLLSETIFYDEAECDGYCLMEDIENLLEYHVQGVYND